MKTILFLSLLTVFFSQESSFEKSKGLETVHPDHVMDFYYELDRKYDHIQINKAGLSDGMRPIHSVVLSKKNHFTGQSKKNELVLMINNGIHSGESCGIDASQLLARQILETDFKAMEDIIIVIIPVYNVGGHQKFSPFNRVNQNGPKKMGFRGNARNFDLNRDFMKMDTRNAFVFKSIYHAWNPDIFIDNHATNGADYQHALTYMINETAHSIEPLRSYIKKHFKRDLEAASKKRNTIPTTYINLKKRGDIKEGINYFHLSPRYSTGYTELFQTISILIETHMLKPYKERVEASLHFMEATLEVAHKKKVKIQAIRKQSAAAAAAMKNYVIQWKRDEKKYETIPFLGYDYSSKFNRYAAVPLVQYDRSKAIQFDLKVYNQFNPVKTISVPKAYLIPQAWHEVIKRLKANGVRLKQVQEKTSFSVEAYRFSNATWNSQAFEGRIMMKNFPYVLEKVSDHANKGDYLVEMNQASNAYIMEALEPDGIDSFLRWGFFNIIFQQKEYFSPYLFVEKIPQLLKEKPQLEEEFKTYLKENPQFEKNPYMRLDFFYKRSPWYEKHVHMRYPILRVLDSL